MCTSTMNLSGHKLEKGNCLRPCPHCLLPYTTKRKHTHTYTHTQTHIHTHTYSHIQRHALTQTHLQTRTVPPTSKLAFFFVLGFNLDPAEGTSKLPSALHRPSFCAGAMSSRLRRNSSCCAFIRAARARSQCCVCMYVGVR